MVKKFRQRANKNFKPWKWDVVEKWENGVWKPIKNQHIIRQGPNPWQFAFLQIKSIADKARVHIGGELRRKYRFNQKQDEGSSKNIIIYYLEIRERNYTSMSGGIDA
jgi:hypothetical protein